jgi:hypothetical protein
MSEVIAAGFHLGRALCCGLVLGEADDSEYCTGKQK